MLLLIDDTVTIFRLNKTFVFQRATEGPNKHLVYVVIEWFHRIPIGISKHHDKSGFDKVVKGRKLLLTFSNNRRYIIKDGYYFSLLRNWK